MNTSYFLFVMVVTLFCYALLKGKPQLGKAKAIQTSETVSSEFFYFLPPDIYVQIFNRNDFTHSNRSNFV